MKAILKSLVVIGTVAGLTIGATSAFFSDVETSTGNVFTAGGIDLKIDNTCHWSGGGACPWDNILGQKANWSESDLTTGVHKFFNFEDIKPGDWGEDTISLHVYNNDAWGRLIINKLIDTDNTCTEPELGTEPGCTPVGDGELRENLKFWVWLDQGDVAGFQCSSPDRRPRCEEDPKEGDNIWLPNEPVLIRPGAIDEGGETWELAPGLVGSGRGLTLDGHMVGSVTYYFGVAWCLGDLVDGTCDGSNIGNDVQTDKFGGDMTFEVVQYRNNPSPFPTPTP